MHARFLLGRAGSGKTRQCLDEIRAELTRAPTGPPLLLLVPEQATYMMDRALLEGVPGGATARAAVVSYRRLGLRLLGEVGGANGRLIGDLGRQMLLQALLRRHAADFELYRGVGVRPGLVANLSQAIHELRQYAVAPRDLLEWRRKVRGQEVLSRKLHDLHLLYTEFLKSCGDQVLDEDELPDLLTRAIAESRGLPGATVWIDSFSDFTKQERQVLAALFRRVERVTIALALDPTDLPEIPGDASRLFARAEETYRDLRALLPATAEVETIPLPNGAAPPRFRSPELLHLERCLFHEPTEYKDTIANVTLVEAGNRRAEVAACAREVLRLARDDGYRYRDIAVIVRDLTAYHDLLEAAFGDLQIPCFIDQRRDMAHHPLVELLRCAVRAVAEDWRHDHVVPYLRTGLVPGIEIADVDILDNYAVEHGLDGDMWYGKRVWDFHQPANPDKDEPDPGASPRELVDVLRLRASRKLHAMHRRMDELRGDAKRARVGDLAAALYELLEKLEVPRTLDEWRREAEQRHDLARASEHRQVWDGVVDLLDELVAGLGGERLTIEEFAEVLEAGLASLTLGLIPPAVDGVLVGSIERSRQPDVRAVFLLGVQEKLFPLVAAENPILNDSERTLAKEASRLELGPTSEERFYQEQYLGYVAFTRASERLWVGYPSNDETGKKLNPSPFLHRLRRALPTLTPTKIGMGHKPPGIDDVVAPQELAAGLVRALKATDKAAERDQWLGVYNQALAIEPAREALECVVPALAYHNDAHLSRAWAEKLYGKELTGSVSRLETFAWCPFQHFARYGLHLKQRVRFRVDVMDLGTLCHGALAYFFEKTRGRPWATLPLDEAQAIISDGVTQEAARLRSQIFDRGARNRYVADQARRQLQLFIHALLEQARHTDFEPIRAEESFGETGADLPPLTFELGAGRTLKLRGRIDRIDKLEKDGQTYLRTVDYKSSARPLLLDQADQGLDLQLIVYLLAICRDEAAEHLGVTNPVPAAAFYSSIAQKLARLSSISDEAAPGSEAFLRNYKLRGVYRDDLWGALDTTSDLSASNHYAMCVTNAGTLGYANRDDFVNAQALHRLIARVHEEIVRLGGEVLDGRISVQPIESHNKTSCTHCDYQDLCRKEAPFNRVKEVVAEDRQSVIARLLPMAAAPEPAASPPVRAPRKKR